jgi:SHS2 domain-containing protein
LSREIVVHGTSLREAFVEAVLALFSLAVDPATVDPREVRETRAHGESPEALLAHWIGECSYIREVEDFVCRAVDLAVFDVEPKVGGEPLRLYAFLHGEAVDPTRHRVRGTGMTVRSHDITISNNAAGACEIRLSVER